MNRLHTLYNVLDFAGTFVFALSGAVAAKQKQLDIFGILALSFTVACGGGILRDICIGVIPPEGLSNWHYMVIAMIAGIIAMFIFSAMEKIKRPVLFFDAIGLSLFAVTGASKALAYGFNGEVAILLGMTTAVGGGVLRDILLNRVPVILQKEIYASAALLGAVVVIIGNSLTWSSDFTMSLAFVICFFVRFMALRYNWNLSILNKKDNKAN